MPQRKKCLFSGNNCFYACRMTLRQKLKLKNLPKRSITHSILILSSTNIDSQGLRKSLCSRHTVTRNIIRYDQKRGPINQTPNLLQLQCGPDREKILRLSQGGNPLCVASLEFSERMTTMCCVISRIFVRTEDAESIWENFSNKFRVVEKVFSFFAFMNKEGALTIFSVTFQSFSVN